MWRAPWKALLAPDATEVAGVLAILHVRRRADDISLAGTEITTAVGDPQAAAFVTDKDPGLQLTQHARAAQRLAQLSQSPTRDMLKEGEENTVTERSGIILLTIRAISLTYQ